jgi:hypothetical protein
MNIAMNEDYGDYTDIQDGRDFVVEAVEAEVAGRKGIKCNVSHLVLKLHQSLKTHHQ